MFEALDILWEMSNDENEIFVFSPYFDDWYNFVNMLRRFYAVGLL